MNWLRTTTLVSRDTAFAWLIRNDTKKRARCSPARLELIQAHLLRCHCEERVSRSPERSEGDEAI